MKASIALLLPAALLLGACTHTRETTIVEKPVSSRDVIIEKPVASRGVIIERPVASREVIVEPPVASREVIVEQRPAVVVVEPVVAYRTCPYGTRAYYSNGDVSCRASYEYWPKQ